MRRQIPLLITFVTGMLMIVAYFIPHHPFGGLRELFNQWAIVIAAFALILGVLNLIKVNAVKIQRKRPGWGYSAVLLIAFTVTTITGLFWGMDRETVFDFIFRNMYVPLGATMFSLLAFFVASASYRAFRARTTEAALLLVAATFVMLGRVPLGSYIWTKFPALANWIMDFPNMAGQRAIMIGIALGTVSMSLRIILGIERSYLGGGE
ncbi:MAG: hypothetical protein J7M27_07305 [Candidatus Latescibacteria bacterium]|nr:hypothetical protein [Candidatus Latescibacterota bacterium]